MKRFTYWTSSLRILARPENEIESRFEDACLSVFFPIALTVSGILGACRGSTQNSLIQKPDHTSPALLTRSYTRVLIPVS